METLNKTELRELISKETIRLMKAGQGIEKLPPAPDPFVATVRTRIGTQPTLDPRNNKRPKGWHVKLVSQDRALKQLVKST